MCEQEINTRGKPELHLESSLNTTIVYVTERKMSSEIQDPWKAKRKKAKRGIAFREYYKKIDTKTEARNCPQDTLR